MSSNHTGYKYRLCAGLAIALGSLCTVQLMASIGRSPAHSLGILPAQAQEAALITEEDIANYASAAAAIETLRATAYGAASDELANANSEVSLVENRLSCLNSTVEDMPDVAPEVQASLQSILVEYCNDAKDIAEENNLTPQRFNSITAEHREDRELAQQIRAAMADSESVSIETVE